MTGSVPVNLTMNDNATVMGAGIAILDTVKVGYNSTVQGIGSLGTSITAGSGAQVTLTGWNSSGSGSPTVVAGGSSTIDLRQAGSGFGVTTGGGTVYGTPYTDTIDTTGGGTIYGEGGSDSVTDSGGGNGLIDLRGNNTGSQSINASGSTGNVTIYGGSGGNTIKGGSGSDTIYTGNGNNVVYDDNGHQSVYGGSGQNTIHAHAGDAYLDGGSGSNNILYFDFSNDGSVTATLTPGNLASNLGNTTYLDFRTIEPIVLGGSSSDSTNLTILNFASQSLNLSDSSSGGDGNDSVTLSGVSVPVTVNLGSGNDSLSLSSVTGSVTASMGSGNDSLSLSSVTATVSDTLGDGNDTVSLNTVSAAASISLGNGNDSVSLTNVTALPSLSMGNGKDSFSINGLSDPTATSATFDLGNANGPTKQSDTVTVDNSSLPLAFVIDNTKATSSIANVLNYDLSGTSNPFTGALGLDANGHGVLSSVATTGGSNGPTTTTTSLVTYKGGSLSTDPGFQVVNVKLGSGADIFTVNNTVNDGSGTADESSVNIDGNGSANQFFVNAVNSPVAINADESTSVSSADTLDIGIPGVLSSRAATLARLFSDLTYDVGTLIINDAAGSSSDKWSVANTASNVTTVSLTDSVNTTPIQVLASLGLNHTAQVIGPSVTGGSLTLTDPNASLNASLSGNAVQVSQTSPVLQEVAHASPTSYSYTAQGSSQYKVALASAVSPDGRFLYVLQYNASSNPVNSIATYSTQPGATPVLIATSNYVSETQPSYPVQLIVSPDGKYLFVNQGEGYGEAQGYDVNQSNGQLSLVTGFYTSFTTGQGGVSVESGGNDYFFFPAEDTGGFFSGGTGNPSTSYASVNELVIHSNGTTNGYGYPIAWSGGSTEQPLALSTPTALAVTPDASYVYASVGSNIYSISTATATSGGNSYNTSVNVDTLYYENSLFAGLYLYGNVESLAVNGSELYASVLDPNNNAVYIGIIDGAGGTIAPNFDFSSFMIPVTGSITTPNSSSNLPLQFSSNGQYAYLFVGPGGNSTTDQGLYVYSVNSGNGELSQVQEVDPVDSSSIDGGAQTTAPVISGNTIYFGTSNTSTAAGALGLPIKSDGTLNTGSPVTVYNGESFTPSLASFSSPANGDSFNSFYNVLDTKDGAVLSFSGTSLKGAASVGLLNSASSLAVDTGGHNIYIVTDSGNIDWYSDSYGNNPQYHGYYTVSGASAIAVTDSNGKVLVGANGSVTVFTKNSDGTLTQSTTFSGSFGQANVILQVNGDYYVSGSAGVQVFNSSFTSVGFLSISGGAGAMAVTPDNGTLLVALTNQGLVNSYSINSSNGTLTLVQQVGTAGLSNVTGLAAFNGPSSTAAFAAVGTGASPNQMLVFTRASGSTTWKPQQVLTQGFGGADGLTSPTGLFYDSGTGLLTVTSAGSSTVAAAVETYDVVATSSTPYSYSVGYSNMSTLTVSLTGTGAMTESLKTPSAATVNLLTPNSADALLVQGTGTSQALNVSLGSSNNVVNIDTTGSSSTTVVTTASGGGGNTYNVWGSGSGSSISITDGGGTNSFRVASTQLGGSSSKLSVTGKASTAADTLYLDHNYNLSLPNGSFTAVTSGASVSYADIGRCLQQRLRHGETRGPSRRASAWAARYRYPPSLRRAWPTA